jgi:hypothetical protein
MVLHIENIVSMPWWNYLGKTPNAFEVKARNSEGAMKNGKSRETENKTQDEDKESKIHNTILDTTMHNMKTEKKHNMCWTPPCTRRRQTKQQQKNNNKENHNMCWTSLFTVRKQTQIT